MNLDLIRFRETVATVFLGSGGRLGSYFRKFPPEFGLLINLFTGFLIGLGFALTRRVPLLLVFLPFFLSGLTILWCFLFAGVAGLSFAEMRGTYSAFFGTSVFLLPAAIPFLGSGLLPILFLGWICVLARTLAVQRRIPPGQVWIQLAVPPVVCLLLLRLAGLFLGKILAT